MAERKSPRTIDHGGGYVEFIAALLRWESEIRLLLTTKFYECCRHCGSVHITDHRVFGGSVHTVLIDLGHP